MQDKEAESSRGFIYMSENSGELSVTTYVLTLQNLYNNQL